MADVVLNHVYKVYPNGVKAVSDFNINIKDKEFIVFVGPSGCGKSTTLRMIAGLEEITTGDLYIGGELVNDVQPKERDIAMVFQNYALYPHMTVFENMAFSLRNKHTPKEEINRRVLEAAKILGIEEYLDRKPKAMSGGQRQRVALGRAIVRDPKVFLLDEPLSNLDAKLRAQMRTEISKLHKKLATTFIYVTHDQVEAMTMGTRIVVMKAGFVQQIDTPTNLYNHPINKFVAGFIGTPQMNFFNVGISKDGEDVHFIFEDKQEMVVPYKYLYKLDKSYLNGDKFVTLGIRPDNVKIVSRKSKSSIELVVTSIEKLGNETLLYCDLGEMVNEDTDVTKSSVIVKAAPTDTHVIGDRINVTFNEELIQLFDNDTEEAIMPYYPTYSIADLEVKDGKMKLFGKEAKCADAFKNLNGTYSVKVPNLSIHEGTTFSAPVIKVEEYHDEYLVTLFNKETNEYIFLTSKEPVEEGTTYNYDVELEDIIFTNNEQETVRHEVEAVGNFYKKKEKNEEGKRVVNFYAKVGGASYLLDEEFIRRFTNVEGRKTLTNDYRIRLTPSVYLEERENSIEHEVLDILNYGSKVYMKVKIGETVSYIDITSVYKEGIEDVNFSYDVTKPIEVYTLDTDVKII